MRRLIAFVGLTTVACGLGPEPDPAGPAGGGGTAPWTELGPATVCLGETVLDGPTAAPGGLCLSPLTPGTTSCASDTDCRSREACVCGRCTVAFCASASDCDPTRACNFAQHRCDRACGPELAPCGDGEECIGSVCRGRCANSSECQHGEVCDRNHVCITDDCIDATGCLAGETCEVQRVPRQTLEPAPLATAGAIVLYLDLALPTAPDDRSIYRAIGDGRRFTIDPPTPVIVGGRAPSAITDGDQVYLYFDQGGEIRVASAPDGIAFGAPVTALAAPAGEPAAVLVDGDVALYHVRGDAIALATGAPGGALVDRGVVLAPADAQVGDPLAPSSARWNPVTRLASPHAVLAGPAGAPSIHLWFAGFGQESPPGSKFGVPEPIPPNYSVGFAAADPGDPGSLAPWPYGPVADRVEVFLEHHDELGPAAVHAGRDRWFLYFVDATHTAPAGAAGPFELGRLQVLGSGRP